MKTFHIFFFFLLSGLCVSTYAQSWHAGMYTGLNLAYLESDNRPVKGEKFSVSAPAGIFINRKLNEWYGIQAGISYVRMGESLDGMQLLSKQQLAAAGIPSDEGVYAAFSNDINLNCLQMPLLVKATIKINPAVTYYALFGPAVSVLLSGRSVIRGNSAVFTDLEGQHLYSPHDPGGQTMVSFNDRISLRDDLRTVTLSGIGAAGLQVNKGRNSFFVETRLTAGFSNIYRDPLLKRESFANALACMIGYMISL